MNSKFFVPFETAKKLKEKGYDDNGCDMWYNADGELDCTAWGKVTQILAPTYHEAIDWLEGKGIILQCYSPILKQNLWQYTAGVFNSNTNDWGTCKSVYLTREEALNAAILKALEMI